MAIVQARHGARLVSRAQTAGAALQEFPLSDDELRRAAGEGGTDVDLQAAYGSGGAEQGACAPAQTAEARGSDPSEEGHEGGRRRGRKRGAQGGAHAAQLGADEVARRRAAWERRVAPGGGPAAELAETRRVLPIAEHRDQVLQLLRTQQVVLIAGETGCGKTTQVPQFILEDSWAAGRGCRVVCTQPRRISAVSVAERVAAERGEAVGENVGYTIRLDSKGGPDCSLMFCTNGVLLRMLTAGGGEDPMATVTHLVVDEIHERDRFADFLLILLRDLLPAHPHLRLVLMSATLHIDLFSGYFGGCPVVRVPGFTHPVQDFYLEDVLRLTGYQEAAVRELEGEGVTPAAIAAGAAAAAAAGGGRGSKVRGACGRG